VPGRRIRQVDAPPIVKAIADRIPGSRYQMMPGGPHMLFIEQPEDRDGGRRVFEGRAGLTFECTASSFETA